MAEEKPEKKKVLRRLQYIIDGRTEAPENPARREALIGGGAMLASSALPQIPSAVAPEALPAITKTAVTETISPAAAAEIAVIAGNLMKKVKIALTYTIRSELPGKVPLPVHNFYDGLKYTFNPNHKKLFPQYHIDYPIINNAQEAVAFAQRELDTLYAILKDSYETNRSILPFLVRSTEEIQRLQHAFTQEPEYKAFTEAYALKHKKPFDITSEVSHIDYLTSEQIEDSLQADFEADIEIARKIANTSLYKRFGVMLPDATAEEISEVREGLKNNFSNLNEFGLDSSAHLTAREYAHDKTDDEHEQPTYIVNIVYKKTPEPEKCNLYLEAWCDANIRSQYPTDDYSKGEDMDLAKHAENGKVLLTPTRMGILITFPAGYEKTDLLQLKESLDKVIAKKSIPYQAAEKER